MAQTLRASRSLVFLLLPSILITSTLHEVRAMDITNPLKTCVFSAVRARLTKNDEPLKGVTILRRWQWHGDEHEDSAVTDAAGQFVFPAVFKSSVTRLLPMEVVIAQSLVAKIDREERIFWVNSKRVAAENSEYNGRPTDLLCELTREMKVYRGGYESGYQVMSTLCTLLK